MWIFSKQGFISIVQHRGDEDLFMVRSRAAEDLERFGTEVVELPTADYCFRTTVSRETVAGILLEELEGIDYTSHVKEAMSAGDSDRYTFYLATWTAGHRFQDKNKPVTVPSGITHRYSMEEFEWDDEEDADTPSIYADEGIPYFPDVIVQLTGDDGNIFAILGRVATALKKADHHGAADEVLDRVTEADNYDEALAIVMEYVEVE